ncbi:protein NRT1/ PTR FAMILY 5.10-like [Rutidosis leptorrhynchoides]|uniref:protein NRT1/ PTR FAMILY 5.10-like n=1 Tax=Rutidosis leptorrhynchoides TaxID=125765 RepID=UPI003A999DD3
MSPKRVNSNFDFDMDDNDTVGKKSPPVNKLVNGVVDYKGRPVLRSKSGCWRSAYFIIGVEVAERFAYYGASASLMIYLTKRLKQSTVTAAENVNVWSGTASLLPLLGSFIADGFIGRYRMIIFASLLYVMALALLAFSTLLPSDCKNAVDTSSCSPHIQVIMFFISLYLMAFAQGGHKPCVQAFGADQFDADDPEELKAKSSFFNWWYFGLCFGSIVGIFVISIIQENLSWGMGFGIPCIIMGFALIIFLLGTMTYRFAERIEGKNGFVRIGRVFVNAVRNWRTTNVTISSEEESRQGSHQFRFLNKALLSHDGSNKDGTFCNIDEVEEAKAVIRLVPIWVSCLAYGIVFAQAATFFTKQAATMDRSIGSHFHIPAAALQGFIGLSIMILIPVYDTVLVPLTRSITNKPSGITMLQRIGTGIVISIISMVLAALVETKRLKTAHEHGLLDDPSATIPMKIWWLVPQYLLAGASDVFTIVGMQEFFYGEMPSDLKSVGLALYLSVMGIGSFLSSFVISVVHKTTSRNGQDGWISNNLNRAHIDYFYYLLAGISFGALLIFIYAAKSYIYNRGRAS